MMILQPKSPIKRSQGRANRWHGLDEPDQQIGVILDLETLITVGI
jgi:hypothetical protein